MAAKILVIDDEQAIGRLLTYQLHDCGYEVCYLADGLAALETLAREEPDLVLLDVMMPLISGWDLCRTIRACSTVPIIMLTAKSADLDVATGLDAGADDYLAKPFSIVQLRARIEAVLRRSRGTPSPAGQMSRQAAFQNDETVERAPASAAGAPGLTLAPPVAAASAPTAAARPAPVAAAPSPQHIGQRLHTARQARNVSLHHAERACRVRWDFLQAMEQGNFEYIPRPQRRAMFVTYAGYLGLSASELLDGQLRTRQPSPDWLRIAAWAALLVLLLLVGAAILRVG